MAIDGLILLDNTGLVPVACCFIFDLTMPLIVDQLYSLGSGHHNPFIRFYTLTRSTTPFKRNQGHLTSTLFFTSLHRYMVPQVLVATYPVVT